MFDGADFLERSLDWAGRRRGRAGSRSQRAEIDRGDGWAAAVARGREIADEKTSGAAPAPYRALDVDRAGPNRRPRRGVRRRGRRARRSDHERGAAGRAVRLQPACRSGPRSRPVRRIAALARPVTKVGIVGAGLMASQLALLFLRRLRGAGGDLRCRSRAGRPRHRAVAREIDTLLGKGASTPDQANRMRASIIGTTEHADYADCDFVLEAVFEEMSVKKDVFASLEKHVSRQLRAGHQHLLAVGQRDGRRSRLPGAGDRLPLLQSGGGAAPARGRPRPGHRRRDGGHRAGRGQDS